MKTRGFESEESNGVVARIVMKEREGEWMANPGYELSIVPKPPKPV
jgi:hypothetical protein